MRRKAPRKAHRNKPSEPTPQAAELTSIYFWSAVLFVGGGLMMAIATGDISLLIVGSLASAILLPFFRWLSHVQ